MGKLYLVRHGETTANAGGRLQGWMNAALSERGKAQAQEAALHFQKVRLDAVYCSTLQRAQKTAEILAAPHGLKLHEEEGLREICFGAWEGLNHEEINARDHEEWAKFFVNPKTMRIPQGENFVGVQERMLLTWEKIQTEQGPDRNILVVAHGGCLRTLICAFLGLDLNYMWRLKVDNVSTTCFEFWDGRPVMQFANHTFYTK